MNIYEKIASSILSSLMDRGIKINKKDYLDIESEVATEIKQELDAWLYTYDVDLNEKR